MAALLRTLDRIVDWIVRVTGVLVLPVGLLLFLQWPLREVVQAYSREANDLAQCLFAIYASVAVTCATRQHAHLATDVVAQRYPECVRRLLARAAGLFVLVPWSLFILYAAWPATMQSIRQLEAFPETFNPGYFILRIAVVFTALLVLVQALLDVFLKRSARAA
jgi:TRAP-type mannitol/chloroaromatic compound transport system permease small subunit